MKRLICIVLSMMFAVTLPQTALAGDVPEALGYENDALVFVGVISKIAAKNEKTTVMIEPVMKIKGEVEIGKLQSYNECNFGGKAPQEDKEYLFGVLDENNVYAYEIDLRDGERISLNITDEFAERVQSYLDDGYYKRLEEKRVNLGKEIRFIDFLGTNAATAESVEFSINGKSYVVDKNAFFDKVENILVKDVEDAPMRELDIETMLYITVVNKVDESIAYAAISERGEVDKCALFMSRLPAVDYRMKTEDMLKIYSLLPKDAREKLSLSEPALNGMTSVMLLVISAAAVFVAAFAVGFIIVKRKRKNRK